MYLVVGLGNPGPRYAETRHNIGFRVVDALARRAGTGPLKAKFSGDFVLVEHDGARLGLLRPQTFMNRSGQSVAAAAAFYKIPRDHVIVIHDELDLDFGLLRLKQGGGEAGHNGLRSVSQHLGGRDYIRVRCGIGRPPASFAGDPADYVLQAFAAAEAARLDAFVDSAADAVLLVVDRGLADAMNSVNRREKS